MSLCVHAGGEVVEYDGLRQLATPAATPTHVPIPHYHLVDVVKHWLTFHGHVVTEEHHAVAKEGNRYFGLLTLKSDYGDYTDTLIMRNSHDKSFPIGIGTGSRVFVCDNLAFIAEHVVRRKHTAKARHELPMLISELVEPLADERKRQAQKLLSYKETPLTDRAAHDGIIRMYDEGVINVQRIPDVLKQWKEPDHDWGQKAVWRLFNAATFALAGRVAENLNASTVLHKIMDDLVIEAA